MGIWVFSTIGIILFHATCFHPTKVNLMIIPIWPNHVDTLSWPNIISSYSCWQNAHYSISNWVNWVRCVVSPSQILFLRYWFTPHHSTRHTPCIPWNLWSIFSNVIHPYSTPRSFNLVDLYWTIQFINELIE
jgi:hypothetical protein